MVVLIHSKYSFLGHPSSLDQEQSNYMGSNEWLWVVTDHLHAAELRPEVSCKIQQTH